MQEQNEEEAGYREHANANWSASKREAWSWWTSTKLMSLGIGQKLHKVLRTIVQKFYPHQGKNSSGYSWEYEAKGAAIGSTAWIRLFPAAHYDVDN